MKPPPNELAGVLAATALLAWSGVAPAKEHRYLSPLLRHAAEISAMVTVCREEAPYVSEHLNHAYRDWLERHPSIMEAQHDLAFGQNTEERQKRRQAYEEMKKTIADGHRQELNRNPIAFSRRCDAFTKDLDSGKLDVRQ